ncbi:hypothetical protein LCGC14_2995290, partial [marine sediment metagenome]
PGTDVTLIAWSNMVGRSLSAAETLAAEGIEVEVIDLRTLVPLDEEAVLIHNFALVSEGRLREEELAELLGSGRWPARNIPERLSDVRAAVAANAAGAELLGELVGRYGLDVVTAYMGHVKANAERAMRAVLADLPDGDHTYADTLDDGSRIAVRVRIDGDRAVVDFTGTDAQLPGNLNAPRAVTVAAVLYVFRTLIPRPVPLNAGCLAAIEIIVPAGSLLDPVSPAAVGKSQRRGGKETMPSTILALDTRSGKTAWTATTVNPHRFYDAMGQWGAIRSRDDWLAYSEQHGILITGKQGQGHALDATTGKPVWSQPISSQPCVIRTDTYIPQDGHIFDIRSGKLQGGRLPIIRGGCNYFVAGPHILL